MVLFVAIVHHNLKSQTENPSRLKFGFDVGMNYSMLKVIDSEARPALDIVPFNGTGFRVGIIADYKLTQFVSFVPKAELSFYGGGLRFIETSGQKNNRQLNPVSLEFAPHFHLYLSEKNARPYILIGGSAQLPIPDRAATDDIYGNNYAFDVGLGFDQKLNVFNLSPEIRYSYGFSNLSDSPFIKHLSRHNLTLVLSFKG